MNTNNDIINPRLTRREIEILKYVSEGKTSKFIGSVLYISKQTVDKHRKNMLKKTGARNSIELVQEFLSKFMS